MSRKKHIDTRNLVVCNTFDEFTNKLEQIDSNVEDIVGYITSSSQVIYGLTVESLWGTLGFTWDNTSILEGVPYNEERIEHIEADGENIDYSQKDAAWKIAHAVTKGYGHFNTTTIPFTLIPTIPDGYRITEFRRTFNSIEADYIEVQKSDWSNLVDINNLISNNKSIKINITGANLNGDNKIIIQNVRNDGWKDNCKHTVYIKGNLGNCVNGIFEYDYYTNWTGNHTILLDDDNKGLNLPLSLAIQNQFYYTDLNKVFDIRDWLYINVDIVTRTNNYISLWAASRKYYIDNKLANILRGSSSSRFEISMLSSLNINLGEFDGSFYAITDPIAQEIEPCSITIDCTKDPNVREDLLCNVTNWQGDKSNVYYSMTQCYNPIEYIGVPASITVWNPYCLVKSDDHWPEYDQEMIDKLTTYSTYGIDEGRFMFGSYIYLSKPSPYTIDCSNLTSLNLFQCTTFIVTDYSNFELIGTGKYALEVVKLTNVNLVFFGIGMDINYGSDTHPSRFYFKLPSIKTIVFGSVRVPKYYIPRTTIIEFSYWYSHWYDAIYVEDITIPHFKFRYIDARDYGQDRSILFDYAYGIAEFGTSTGPVNLYEFEDGLLQDISFLKASKINTFRGTNSSWETSREIIHPLVCVDNDLSYDKSVPIISSSYVFVYKANITFSVANSTYTQEQATTTYNTFKALLYGNPGIQVNDTGQVYTIKLKKSVYDLLTTAEKNHIMNDLNYQLSYDL